MSSATIPVATMIPLLAGFVVIPLVIACAALTLDSPISPEQATHLNYAARGLLLAFALLEFVSARLFRTVSAAECHGFRRVIFWPATLCTLMLVSITTGWFVSGINESAWRRVALTVFG